MVQRAGAFMSLAIALGLFVLAGLGIISPLIVAVLAGAGGLYFLLQERLWLLLVAVPPALLLGTVARFEVKPNWFYDINAGEILLMIAVVLFTLDIIWRRRTTLTFGAIGWCWLVYLILAAGSFFYISDQELFVAGFKVLIFSFAAYVLARNLLDTDGKRRAFMRSLMVFVVILSIQVFYALARLGFSADIMSDRSSILVPFGPLALAAAALSLIVPVVMGYYFSRSASRQERLLLFLSVVAGLVAIFTSLGKAAALSVLIGLAYLVYKLKEKRIIIVLSVAFFALIAMIALYPFTQGFVQRVTTATVDNTTTFRVKEYGVITKIIGIHPWRGVGIGEQLNQYRRLLDPDYAQLANNFLLQAAMDLGLFGLLAYLALAVSILLAVRRLQVARSGPLAWGLSAGLLAAFVNGMFEVTAFAFQYGIVLWLIVGFMSAFISHDPDHAAA